LQPKFSGPFHTWRQSLFTDREKGIETVLLVYSSGSREAVREYLWLKFLWNQLSQIERTLFLASLRDTEEKKWSTMKLMQIFPKKVIRRRLNNLEFLFGEKVSSKERLSGYYQLRIEIREETRRLPRPPKFSGYIKSPSAAGSKRQLVRQLLDEMVTGEEYVDVEKVSWYKLLSVESVSLFLGRGVIGS